MEGSRDQQPGRENNRHSSPLATRDVSPGEIKEPEEKAVIAG